MNLCKSIVVVIFLGFHSKCKIVVFLEFSDSFESFLLNKLSHCSAVCELKKVGFEVIVCESEIEELLWIFFHLLEFWLHHDFNVLVDFCWYESRVLVWNKKFIIFHFVAFIFLEESNSEFFPWLSHGYQITIRDIKKWEIDLI